MSNIPGTEHVDVKYTSPLAASHDTLAVVTLPPPDAGRVWEILRVTAKSDLAGKVITIKVGASIAAVATKGPTLPIGAEAIVQPLTGYLCTGAGVTQSDNQAVTVSCSASAAAALVLEARSIPTPVFDTTSGIAVTSA